MKKKVFDDQLIVITGAAGFIGSCVVKHLNEKGFTNLLLVDDLAASEKWRNLVGKKFFDCISRYELFDWLDGKESQIEAFIHLGACSSTIETDGDLYMEMNYRYSVELAEYAIKHGHRFIYASSAATYGRGERGYVDDPAKIDELYPLNRYALSKQMFDQWVVRNNFLNKVVGLKYFNIYGPNEYHKGTMASMVHHMLGQILETKKVRLFKSTEPEQFKDGEQCRDFLYVKDAVALTCAFLENEVSGIFNVGSGEANTWNALAKAVFAASGHTESLEYFDMPAHLVSAYQNFTKADMGRVKEAFKQEGVAFPKFHSLEEGVSDYVKNYLLKGKTW